MPSDCAAETGQVNSTGVAAMRSCLGQGNGRGRRGGGTGRALASTQAVRGADESWRVPPTASQISPLPVSSASLSCHEFPVPFLSKLFFPFLFGALT